MNIFRAKQRGFTLIELLVVIAVIGILASVILASLNSARVKARDARRKSDIKQISTAIEMYYNDHGFYPPGNNIAGTNQFCMSTPTGASGETSDEYGCWKEGGTLATALKPYIPQLPTDPTNKVSACWADGGHFYTYISLNQGKGYSLLTSLENANDPSTRELAVSDLTCCASTINSCMHQKANGGYGIMQL